MYYRYFKKGVNIPSISEVMNFFTHDDRVQHPEVINALKQFNVYPELFLSLFYRSFSPALLGLPIDFYVNSVHFFNGFYLGAIFLFGVILSRNIYGGLFSVFCFMMNHGHNTRAWWSISLRESIAMPFFACQVVVLGYYLRIAYDKAKKERSEEEKQKNTDKKGKEDSTESDEVDDSFFSSADTRLFNEKVSGFPCLSCSLGVSHFVWLFHSDLYALLAVCRIHSSYSGRVYFLCFFVGIYQQTNRPKGARCFWHFRRNCSAHAVRKSNARKFPVLQFSDCVLAHSSNSPEIFDRIGRLVSPN